MDRFLLAIKDLQNLIAGGIMLFTGLRVGELEQLLVRDVCPERCSLFVRQGKGGKDRWAPVDIDTVTLIRSFAGSRSLKPDDHLIGCSTRTVQRHIEEICGKAGITWGRDPPHPPPHLCAAGQWHPSGNRTGEPGPEDIQTTQIYLHLNIRQRSRTHRDAPRFGA